MLYAEIDEAKLRMYDRQGDIEEGLERGRMEGMEMGMANGMKKAARAMKAEGMNPDTIARITGLAVDDILRL